MSALMTPRRSRSGRRSTRPAPAPGGQPALFGAGAPPAAPEQAAPAPAAAEETATTARAHRHGPTLDEMVAGAWEGLLAGAPADCLVCGAALAPRHSAGAGIVGGRCGGCGTTVS